MGSEAGARGYLLTFSIAYLRDFMLDYKIIGETFECSQSWNKVVDTTIRVRKRLELEHRKMLDKYSDLPYCKPFLSWRLTQFYDSCVVIYFMFGYYCGDSNNAVDSFLTIEHSLRDEIILCSGSISHHHGVGKIRKPFIRDHMHYDTVKTLMNIRGCIDTHGILQTGNTY